MFFFLHRWAMICGGGSEEKRESVHSSKNGIFQNCSAIRLLVQKELSGSHCPVPEFMNCKARYPPVNLTVKSTNHTEVFVWLNQMNWFKCQRSWERQTYYSLAYTSFCSQLLLEKESRPKNTFEPSSLRLFLLSVKAEVFVRKESLFFVCKLTSSIKACCSAITWNFIAALNGWFAKILWIPWPLLRCLWMITGSARNSTSCSETCICQLNVCGIFIKFWGLAFCVSKTRCARKR